MSATPADEVDFGRYWAALGARWWLLLAGLLAGALVGYLTASGAKQVNRASETIYLGQPLTAGGSGLIQTLQTNPSVVRQGIHSNDAIAAAAANAGRHPRRWSAGCPPRPTGPPRRRPGRGSSRGTSAPGSRPSPSPASSSSSARR